MIKKNILNRSEQSSWLAIFMTFVASLGGFLFGYNIAVISGALIFIAQEYGLSAAGEGFLVSILLIGAIAGASFAGFLADRWGRRSTILLTALIFILGAWLAAAAPNLNALLLGRFICGLAVGLTSMVTPLYLAEIAPPHTRGAFVSIHQLAITVGILAAYILNYVFSESALWRWMIGLAVIPSAFQFVAMLFLPETPSWLIEHRKTEQAVRVFSRIRKDREWERDIEEMKNLAPLDRKIKWSTLLKPEMRFVLAIGVFVSLFQQITGINTVIYYAPKIFQIAGFPSVSSAILATVGIGVINVIATLIAVWLLDRIGRRKLLLIGVCGMVISLLVLSAAFITQSQAIDLIAIISLMAYVSFFAIGLGAVTWVLISEIYPLRMRGRAMSIAGFVNWISNYLVALTFLDLIEYLGSGGVFLIYAAFGIAAIWFFYRYVPETKGKSLETIEASMLKKSKRSGE